MSEMLQVSDRAARANRAEWLEGSRLARTVHRSRQLVLSRAAVAAILLGGCVIPPSLSVADQADAGVNSPPAILAVHGETAEYTEGGTINLPLSGMSSMTVDLVDTDVADALNVRMYVGYTSATPVPPRVICDATPNDTAYRSATCETTSLCPGPSGTDPFHVTIAVFDRTVLNSGNPMFMAMPPDGMTTSKFFFLSCM
jgi:hypothetical protein